MNTCPTCGSEITVEEATFGTRLRQARIELELTKEDLAASLGYERTSIVTRWESGQLVPRDIEVVETVAYVLGVTPAWLLYGVQEPKLFTEVADAVDIEPPDEDAISEDEFEEPHDEVPHAEWVDEDEIDPTSTEASGRARPAILNRKDS